MIIDIHTHIGDLIAGGEIPEPYDRPPRLISNLFEGSGFRLMGGKGIFPHYALRVEIRHNRERMKMGTPENLVKYMDRYGVSVSVLQPIASHRSQAYIPELRDDRLRSFASVHPGLPKWKDRLHDHMGAGCLGLKIHPVIQNLACDDPAVFDLIEEFATYDRPVLLHAGESSYRWDELSAARLGRVGGWGAVFSAFPATRFIVAHMAMEGWKEAIELGERLPNLFVDTSFQPVSHVREAIRRLGGERVLYASDWPFSLQGVPLKIIAAASRGDGGLREALLCGNARSLLGL
jgi:uncharacterized protein